MADPISIVSLVEGSISLVLQCGSVAKTLSDIAGKYKQSKLTVLSMVQEVETIQLAWSRIKEWSQAYAEAADDAGLAEDSDRSFLERLDRSLECGTLVISALQDDLSDYADHADDLSFRQRSRVAWNEKALQDHQHRIRGQVMAMSLLLQVLELPTPKDRSKLLKTKEHHFRKSDESAYSIVPSEMSSRMSSGLSVSTHIKDAGTGTDITDMIYRRLSFEDELFTAMVYKRSYRSPIIRSLLQLRYQAGKVDDRAFVADSHLVAETGFGCLTRVRNKTPAEDLAEGPALTTSSSAVEDEELGSDRYSILLERRPDQTLMQRLNDDLQMSVRAGKCDDVMISLAQGAQIDHIPPHSQWSPLHHATYNGDVAMVQLLVQHGAVIDNQRENGEPPIHLATEKGSLTIVLILLDAGANIYSRDNRGEQPLHRASRHWDRSDMIELLVANGADLEDRDGLGRSPLQLACRHKISENFRALLRLGATIPAPILKNSSLKIAISMDHMDFVKELLRHGVNPNAQCFGNGMTGPMLLVSSQRLSSGEHILQTFTEQGADLRLCDHDGNQVFHHFSRRTQPWGSELLELDRRYDERLMQTLLDRGADINAVNNAGDTPLFLAAKGLRLQLAGLYCDKGAGQMSPELRKRLHDQYRSSDASPKHDDMLKLLEGNWKPSSLAARRLIQEDPNSAERARPWEEEKRIFGEVRARKPELKSAITDLQALNAAIPTQRRAWRLKRLLKWRPTEDQSVLPSRLDEWPLQAIPPETEP